LKSHQCGHMLRILAETTHTRILRIFVMIWIL
jgi:hypothetical protein